MPAVATTRRAPPVGAPWRAGEGAIAVVRTDTSSVVTRARAASPLKLLTPGNTGKAAWVYVSTYGGGLVDGDAMALTIDVGPAAMAMVSTQASTKVYRSPSGTRSDLTGRIAEGGLLVSIPEPVVCYAGARYGQQQQFEIESGASLVHLDWLSCGRLAHGERWAFDEYRTSLAVRRDGRLICYDALTLAAADGPLADRFGRFDALATIVVLGPRVSERVQGLLAASFASPPRRDADLLSVASPIADGAGCLVRVAAVSLEDLHRVVRQLLDFLPAILGDDPWARRW